jgi:hypothetical protein
MHEVAIGMQNARRSDDMMLATCLADVLERMRSLQADAIQTMQAVHDTHSVEAARNAAAGVAAKNEQLAQLLETASSCEGGEQRKTASDSHVTIEVEADFDFGTGSPIDPPVIAPPPEAPAIIDVMEPGTDVPVPPTASPMR